MREYHDPSFSVDAFQRQDISVIREENYESQRAAFEVDQQESSKKQKYCKRTVKFLFSHIGLVGLVVIYAVAGGFLFELLEKHQEKYNCQEAVGEHAVELSSLKQEIVTYIRENTTGSATATAITYGYTKDNSTIAYERLASMLYEYREFIIETGSKYRYYGDDCSVTNKWTFANSLLFAITIITTIGYGNISPVTWEGQICCICYATIGIPIFLLCVANISGVLGEMFRFLYGRIICAPCKIFKRRRAQARKMKIQQETGLGIGNSNGLAVGNDLDDEEQQRRNQRVTVPLTITMLIIVAYICIGAALFHRFEEWSMIQAAYFCFITLATIGFGDFVPGQQKDDPGATYKLIIGSIYVLFGMAILAMCFDLMQEEIVAKFRWIGRKIGIYDKLEKTPSESTEKNSIKDKQHSDGSASFDRNQNFMEEKPIQDDFDNGWSTQRSNSGTNRKLSPRINTARVHPMANVSNEGTLHQRSTSSKQQ